MSFKAIIHEMYNKQSQVNNYYIPSRNETRQLNLVHSVFERQFLQTKFHHLAGCVQSITEFMLLTCILII